MFWNDSVMSSEAMLDSTVYQHYHIVTAVGFVVEPEGCVVDSLHGTCVRDDG